MSEKNLLNLSKNIHSNQNSQLTDEVLTSIPTKKVSKHSDLPIITKITPQKNKHRFNIFIDDQFAFGISEDILVKYQIHKGMALSEELKVELLKNEAIHKAYQRCLNYLSYRQRSEKEICDYLAEKGYDEEIPEVIVLLKEKRLLDDQEFANAFVRTAVNGSKKGPRIIEHQLLEKGIEPSMIQEAIFEYFSSEQQIKVASTMADKKWTQMRQKSEREAYDQLTKYLYQRGFYREEIRQVMDAFDQSMDQGEEYDHLKHQGNKALKKYQRKAQGYKLAQKLKGYLFRKKYPIELIDKYIEEISHELEE